MRRQLLTELPSLTRFYGIKPQDVESMTLREIWEYRRQMEDAARKGEADDGR